MAVADHGDQLHQADVELLGGELGDIEIQLSAGGAEIGLGSF